MTKDLISNAYGCLRGRLVVLFLVMLLAGSFEGIGLTLLFPLLAKFGIGGATDANLVARAVDSLLSVLSVPNDLGSLLIFIVAVFYLQVGFSLAKVWLEADCQTRYTQYWQQRLFGAFIDAGWAFLVRRRSATHINAIMAESGRISAAFYMLMQMAASAIFIAVYGAISFATSWQMVLILGLFGSVIYVCMRPLSRRGQTIGGRVNVVNEGLQARTNEFLQSAKLIKATATEPTAKSLFGDAVNRYRRTFRLAGFHPNLVQSIYMLCGYALLGLGVWVAVEPLGVNPATVIIALYVFLRLYVQLTNFQQQRQTLAISLPALPAAMQHYREARAAAEYLHGGRRLSDSEPAAICFRDATVRYGDKSALDNASFEIPAGTFVGVTGPSGAGKSTLVDIVVGLVNPGSGRVLVDGVALDELDIAFWRRSIGYVAQETMLLNGSVASNIAWGAADGDRAAVERAARLANATEFIAELPDGLDTEVGERGAWLSGGQRQRIGLARALIGEKRLLILDEATSALDSESEFEILKALETLRGSVTILMVAHRLSTLKNADRILLMENGRLVESGDWAQLTAADGSFSRLWRLQNTAPHSAS